MGMFDNLCLPPQLLPVSGPERELLEQACAGGFQTKSFNRDLSVIQITSQGRLRRAAVNWDAISAGEPPADPTRIELSIANGNVTTKHYHWVEETDFTGEVRFYTSVEGDWYEFSAVFTTGELVEIVQLSL